MNALEKLKALTGVLLNPVVSRPSKTQRCFRDGKWQVDDLANLSEKLEREISAIEDAVNASGTAIGDGNSHYTTAERIRDITAQRDYFMRECDKARAANADLRQDAGSVASQPKEATDEK